MDTDEDTSIRISLDLLPSGAALLADIDRGTNMARFRAVLNADIEGERIHSEWSGWFPVTAEPIVLVWASFWDE